MTDHTAPAEGVDRLSGGRARTAIVTGGARGLGAAIARRLARDGLAVAVVDLDADRCLPVRNAILDGGGSCIALGADVCAEDEVERAVARCVEELGEPTVLVNNAGITRDNLLFRMSVVDWDAVAAVHLRGAFLMSRAVMPFMTSAGWGRIVNMSRTSALGNRGQANYSAAKAGLQGFTKTLAIESGRFGVTVNALAPGFVRTDMLAQTAVRLGKPLEELIGDIAAGVPAARIGEPDDVAAAASFFVSDEASYVSGQVLYVAGGPTD